MTRSLSHLKNIGAQTEGWLHEVGIHTLDDLEALGAVEAYRRLKASRPGVTRLALYALQGALLNLHWNALPPDMKAELNRQADEV